MSDLFFIKALIRRANKEEDPIEYLENIVFSTLDVVTSDSGQKILTSSSINGKTFSWQIPQDMTQKQFIGLVQQAIEWIETGFDPRSDSRGNFN